VILLAALACPVAAGWSQTPNLRTALAAKLRATEQQVASASARMDELVRQRDAAARALAARSAALQPMLPALQRLSLYPAQILLAAPANPELSIPALLVLRDLARTAQLDAASLRRQQDEVASLAAQIDQQGQQLASLLAAQTTQANLLDRQIQAPRPEAPGSGTSELARQQVLAQPRGQLTAPVAGQVIRAFGDPTDAGPATGLSYATPPNARVVSPCGGKVVFAAPFRSFGLLLIVDCGGGYHFVLSGLSRLDAQIGQMVQAGEPVGIMPAWDPRGPAERASQRPSLYVELRHDGVPVNPAPWLRARG
jgi:septal ring factor EnvC (AmiA/AmiB activator)